MPRKPVGLTLFVLVCIVSSACQFGELADREKRDQFVEQKVSEQNQVNITHDAIVQNDCGIMLSLWEAWNEKKGPPREEAKEAATKLTIDSNVELAEIIPKIGKDARYSRNNIYNLLTGWTETNCGRIFGWEDKVITPYTE